MLKRQPLFSSPVEELPNMRGEYHIQQAVGSAAHGKWFLYYKELVTLWRSTKTEVINHAKLHYRLREKYNFEHPRFEANAVLTPREVEFYTKEETP